MIVIHALAFGNAALYGAATCASSALIANPSACCGALPGTVMFPSAPTRML
jgi:hypothetical protein